jgi:hypothetical protein
MYHPLYFQIILFPIIFPLHLLAQILTILHLYRLKYFHQKLIACKVLIIDILLDDKGMHFRRLHFLKNSQVFQH